MQKKGLIDTLLSRAYNICSNYSNFLQEINYLKTFSRKNSSLLFFINRCVQMFLNKLLIKRNHQNLTSKSNFFTWLCRPQNSFAFLKWWVVSEMELENSRTILHIRGQNCSLGTRSRIQFHYIYKIPNTCLLLPNQLEMRSQKSWELVTPSS